ncbi:unannotated protein [freshwater metagenome]|uniref:Unannotated protein n=1 Tax=freshwater metagenome TaxID=449393 RepID=A0A6J7C126_9ZZZZ
MPRTVRSPTRSTMRPAGSALTRRTSAKTLTTALAQKAETPNVSAKSGIAGATMPKPRATQKATSASTNTSRGSLALALALVAVAVEVDVEVGAAAAAAADAPAGVSAGSPEDRVSGSVMRGSSRRSLSHPLSLLCALAQSD